ncbi:hypothetical protein A6A06_16140 [Streptomyces sp. CB02923]|nr:hypothetical protein A6A06_16140 [Streptomyces sp. CB02923]
MGAWDGRKTLTVPLSSLLPSDSPRLDGEDMEYVRRLAGLDVALPPIVVHRDTMRVIDGMHRVRAAELRGEDRIEVHLLAGRGEDAFVLAVRLNSANGRPLSQADRVGAAARILVSHPQWSDRRIAAVTGLVAGTVAAIRERSTEHVEQLKIRVGRDGRYRPLNPAEGRLRAYQLLKAEPDRTLRQVATDAGVSIATAKDVRDRLRQGRDPLPPKLRATLPRRDRPRAAEPPRNAPAGSSAGAVAALAETTLPRLGKDPSMRTEAGRALLQLLRSHAICNEERRRWLAERVPEHCREAVAQAARACADHWLKFAEDIESGTH